MSRRKKRSSRKFIYLFLFIFLALGGGGYYYYDQVYLPAQVTPEPEMQTAKVRTGDIIITASGLGTVVPASEVELGFKTGGVMVEINTAVGEDVVEGEILAQLDDTNIQIQILEAQRDLEYLTSPYALAAAEQALIEALEALEDAEYNQLALQEGYRTSNSVIDSTKAALILAQEKVDKAQEKYNLVAHLAEDNLKRATALAELSAAVEARDTVLRQLNWYL